METGLLAQSLDEAALPEESCCETLAAAHELLREAALRLAGPSLGPRRRIALRNRWTQQTPELSRRLAAVLEAAPEPFQRLPVTAGDLRARRQRVAALTELGAVIRCLSDRVADLLLIEKAALHGRSELVLGAIDNLLASPTADPAVVARLEVESRPARDLVRERRAAIRSKKRRRAQLQAEDAQRQERIAAAEEERTALLGATGLPLLTGPSR